MCTLLQCARVLPAANYPPRNCRWHGHIAGWSRGRIPHLPGNQLVSAIAVPSNKVYSLIYSGSFFLTIMGQNSLLSWEKWQTPPHFGVVESHKKKKKRVKCVQSSYENLYVKNRAYSTCTDSPRRWPCQENKKQPSWNEIKYFSEHLLPERKEQINLCHLSGRRQGCQDSRELPAAHQVFELNICKGSFDFLY